MINLDEHENQKDGIISHEKKDKPTEQSQNVFTQIVNEVYPQRSLLVLSKGMSIIIFFTLHNIIFH